MQLIALNGLYMIKLVLFALLFISQLSLADEYTGQVINVVDGDTVTLLTNDNQKLSIRLSGIDAPEMNQNWGLRSKQAMCSCADGLAATVEANKKDKYGRLVGKVIVKGIDCNLRQIQLGLAWHYKKYEKEQEVEERSTYAQEEYLAQSAGLGLWVDKQAIPPWEFRKMVKDQHIRIIKPKVSC